MAVLALLAALAALYIIPFPKKLDVTLTGFRYAPSSGAPGEQVQVSVSGTYVRYLFRPGSYDARLRISGVEEELCVRGVPSESYGLPVDYPSYETDYPYGIIFVAGGFEALLLRIYENGSFPGRGFYIVAPASSRAEAAALAPSVVKGTRLESIKDW